MRAYGSLERDIRDMIVESIPEIDSDDILDLVRKHYGPEDVFTVRDLEAWATEHGWGESTDE